MFWIKKIIKASFFFSRFVKMNQISSEFDTSLSSDSSLESPSTQTPPKNIFTYYYTQSNENIATIIKQKSRQLYNNNSPYNQNDPSTGYSENTVKKQLKITDAYFKSKNGYDNNNKFVKSDCEFSLSRDGGVKDVSFSAEQVQCMCEALQQRKDFERLTTFLGSLPESDILWANESVLR